MKYYCIAIVFAAIVTGGVVSAQQQAAVNICANVSEYMFIEDVTNCTKYYICVNGRPISQVCDNKLNFDADAQSCTSSSAKCLQCQADKLTFSALKRTCNKYVLCYAGTPVVRQCADDLQFNPQTGLCNEQQIVDCVDNKCALPNNVNNIVYIPSASNCSNYYICMNAQPLLQSCVKTLQFNPSINACDLASNVGCTVKANKRSAQQPAISAMPELIDDFACPAEGAHFYPHVQSNRYYVCVNGKGAILTCAEGLFYDSKAESCRQLKNILLR